MENGKLNEKQLKAIFLLAHTTKKKVEVAREIGVDDSTISRWFRDQDFIREYDLEMRSAFKEYAGEAQKELLSLLYSAQSESVKLGAIKELLSKAGYDAVIKTENTNREIIISLEEPDGEDGGPENEQGDIQTDL